MRLIDGDALYKAFEEVYNKPDRSLADAAWWFFGKLEDAPTIAPPPNDPLTLEELRDLYTTDPYDCCLKPVWIEIKKDMPYSLGSRCSGYDLIGIDDSYPDFAISICDRFLHMKSYGEYWIAYRRKPDDWKTGGNNDKN